MRAGGPVSLRTKSGLVPGSSRPQSQSWFSTRTGRACGTWPTPIAPRISKAIGDSSHAVAREVLGNVRLDGSCGSDIGIAAHGVACPQLRLPAPEQGSRIVRIRPQRSVVKCDGAASATHLQIGKRQAVKCVDQVGLERQRLVAIDQRSLQLTDNGSCPATVVPGVGILRIDSNDLVEIADRAPVLPLPRQDQAPPEIGRSVVRVALDFLVELADRAVVERPLARWRLGRWSAFGLC